uniref:Enoyl reductase (ER) domain-containing protein n=1 Tax=Zooxanthella nutricula TaxID=1333877 RepID=A0A6U6QBK3_9DINO
MQCGGGVPRQHLLGLPTSGSDRGFGGASGGFRAWVVDAHRGELKQRSVQEFGVVSELPRQDPAATVTVRVHFSDLNYKDAMIIRGQHGVCKGFPIVPGIDFSGVVEQSDSPLWRAGDEVVLTGNKIGQHFDGGWSGLCRVQAEWLVPRPKTFSLEDCMAIGTAGFTAMQMVVHLEKIGSMTTKSGPILVTGAGGGVGSTAVALLANLGYHVVASTGRPDELGEYLRSLGAKDVIGRLEGDGRKQPLQAQRWSHVVDTVGGPILSAALAQTKLNGSVAAVGVAAGGTLDTTVYPFVLRGVRLLGVDSTLPWNVEGFDDDPDTWLQHRRERLALWSRLERDMPLAALRKMHMATVPLEDAHTWAEELLAGRVKGRVVIAV